MVDRIWQLVAKIPKERRQTALLAYLIGLPAYNPIKGLVIYSLSIAAKSYALFQACYVCRCAMIGSITIRNLDLRFANLQILIPAWLLHFTQHHSTKLQ
jgi:hypothetical protein